MNAPQPEAALRAALGNEAPGVAVVIVDRAGVRARIAAGTADVISDRPMSTDIALPWFSMTKIATATAAIRLTERGVLDLDEPVASLLPAMKLLQPASWAAEITARHLLQHTAGFPNPMPITWIHPSDQPGPGLEAMLTRLLTRNRRLRFPPGTRSSYSNLGTLALGSTISHAATDTFENVVRDELLEPLMMTATSFDYPPGRPAATGTHRRYSPARLLLPKWVIGPSVGRWMTLHQFLVDGAPYGGLIGTAEDAARLLQMHLRGGELDGTRIISEYAATEMRQITARGKRYDLGLGWITPATQRDARPAFVEHLGGGAGFYNTIRIYPTQGIGIVVMGNSTKYDINAIANVALNLPHRQTRHRPPHPTRRPSASTLLPPSAAPNAPDTSATTRAG